MKRPRKKTLLVVTLVVMLVLLVIGEIVARKVLGLGDPPVMIADDAMEYRFAPGESQRFGNRVYYNDASMRSRDITPQKASKRERRILMLGDSVINGGSQTDQLELASELLEEQLDSWFVMTWVGNVSAGSWGPGNLLAYVERFGWYDADVVVIVLSSHDAWDVPTYEPIVGVSASFPDRKPVLALQEVVTRYLPRYLPWGQSEALPEVPASREDAEVESALGALRELIASAKTEGIPVIVAQHWSLAELKDGPLPGHAWIAEVATETDVTLVDLGEVERAHSQTMYRDNIHPNAEGQRVIADALEPVIRDAFNPPTLFLKSYGYGQYD